MGMKRGRSLRRGGSTIDGGLRGDQDQGEVSAKKASYRFIHLYGSPADADLQLAWDPLAHLQPSRMCCRMEGASRDPVTSIRSQRRDGRSPLASPAVQERTDRPSAAQHPRHLAPSQTEMQHVISFPRRPRPPRVHGTLGVLATQDLEALAYARIGVA
ncbi:hypothetical protein B0H19DRAFT_1366556 [Mycena capillaripes]|nr:hypothetical protein B0H19DRAFT_1366556 [Mycena capillaripes]